MKVSSGSPEEGTEQSTSVSPRKEGEHQPKKLRISDQSSWSCTSSSDERAKRIGVKYGKRSDDSARESCESPTGEIVLRAKEEECGGDDNPGSEPRTSAQKESSVVRQTRAGWEEANTNSSRMAWNASEGGKIRPKERKDLSRGGDRSNWKKWKGDWRSRTVEVARSAGNEDRRGMQRDAKDSILPRHKKDSSPR